ncbi:DUF6074 family protein [Rhizobium lentis]|uniref:DUF6074 family protein n=1 Tax=Rhizobium lentis TaxID=1138194 RepID=UPI001C833F08|nr:DUF6074 family protein [Rhizobium lentis]MBX5034238.1 hypothetical protein [Rhizobium lentis]
MCQLDLFRRSDAAAVVMFPLSRQPIARRIARELSEMNFDQGKRHWLTSTQKLRANLQRQGLQRIEIKAQLEQLAQAIHIELESLKLTKQNKKCSAVIISMSTFRAPGRVSAGEAGGSGQGAKLLAGVGGAHEERSESDSTHEREGGAA